MWSRCPCPACHHLWSHSSGSLFASFRALTFLASCHEQLHHSAHHAEAPSRAAVVRSRHPPRPPDRPPRGSGSGGVTRADRSSSSWPCPRSSAGRARPRLQHGEALCVRDHVMSRANISSLIPFGYVSFKLADAPSGKDTSGVFFRAMWAART